MRFDAANLGKKNDLTKILAKENEDNGLRNRVNFRGGERLIKTTETQRHREFCAEIQIKRKRL